MKKILLLILTLAWGGVSHVSGQVLTGFGSTDTNPLNTSTDFLGSWSGTQTATSVTVTSVPSNSGGIFSNLATPETISNIGTKFLTLTGALSVSTPSTSVFSITLFDNTVNQNTLTYSFTFAQFVGSGIAFSGALTDPQDLSVFGGTIASYELDPGGGPLATPVTFRFDNLAFTPTFVPEPSTYAMLGFGLVLLYGVYHRKARQA